MGIIALTVCVKDHARITPGPGWQLSLNPGKSTVERIIIESKICSGNKVEGICRINGNRYFFRSRARWTTDPYIDILSTKGAAAQHRNQQAKAG
jgi:hypothetical protein